MFPLSFRKVFFYLMIGGGLVWVYAIFHTLYIHDISLEKVYDKPLPGSQGYVKKPYVYVVSYADGPEVFLQNQNSLATSVINRGADFILNYRKHHLNADFVKKNSRLLDYSKGAGYWVWKPWIILQTLKTVPENSIVIYFDSGFVVTAPLTPLIELAKQHDIILIKHDDLNTTCGMITQPETFNRMGCKTDACYQSPHLWSAISVYRNTPAARQFVEKWLAYCQDPVCVVENEILNVGTPQEKSSFEPYPGFIHHHHDESIVSVLYAKEPEGKYILPLAELNKMKLVFWHHRHPKAELQSILPYIHRGIVNKWERWCYWLVIWPVNKLKSML
jgi:hypothetical protein